MVSLAIPEFTVGFQPNNMDSPNDAVDIKQVDNRGPGKVAIYETELKASIDSQELGGHDTCIAKMTDTYVLASHDRSQLLAHSPSCIAEFTLGEADSISENLRNSCFVFLTQKKNSRPKQSLMIKLIDWKRLADRKNAKMCGDSSTPINPEFYAAVFIEIKGGPKFTAVCVNADAILNWDVALYNVGSWLHDVWAVSGTWIKPKELELCALKSKQTMVAHTDHVFNFGDEFKIPLLICHLFKYWVDKKTIYKERGEELAGIIGAEKAYDTQTMHRYHVNASCINPPLDRTKELYGSLRKDIKRLYQPAAPSTHSLDPKVLCWLLSVRFPVEFAQQIEAGKDVADLTGSSDKKVQVEIPILKSR